MWLLLLLTSQPDGSCMGVLVGDSILTSRGFEDIEEHPGSGDEHHNGEHEEDIIIMQVDFLESPTTDQGAGQKHQVDGKENREDTTTFLPDFLRAM